MPSSPDYVAHCAELLSPLGAVRINRMFGGHGFYVDEVFVAIVSSDQLYLKTDVQTRPHFEAAGCQPFVYDSARKKVALGYWSAPEDAMESPALMLPWARLAMDAAVRARKPKPAKRVSAAAAAPAKKRVKKVAAKNMAAKKRVPSSKP